MTMQNPEQVLEHYRIERELAARLLSADREQRRHLYTAVYDELFSRVPHHPQLSRKVAPDMQQSAVDAQMRMLAKLLNKDTVWLEVGPGDCALTFAVARQVRLAHAVDVSETITRNPDVPENFHLSLSDGCSIPVAAESIDVVYSNQLMEHLHPEDAHEQLTNIFRALKAGGCYLCITPNRLTGPHDVSRGFDVIATGFHLKEYTMAELCRLFRAAGFVRLRCLVGVRGVYLTLPTAVVLTAEWLLQRLPVIWQKRLANNKLIDVLTQIRLLARKA